MAYHGQVKDGVVVFQNGAPPEGDSGRVAIGQPESQQATIWDKLRKHSGSVTGRIETGRWYDIRIGFKGVTIKGFLDGKLIHDTDYGAAQPLYAVASRDNAKGEVILKLVNVADQPHTTELRLSGAASVASSASAVEPTSARP